MITKQQQAIAYSELSRLFDPEDQRLTVIERSALRVAMAMLINKPVDAGEQADALEMLIRARSVRIESENRDS